MKKCLFLLFAVVLLATGCSKRGFYGEEARETLLSTIPAKSNFVALLDLETFNSALGNKYGEGKVQTGQVFQNFCNQMMNASGQKFLTFLQENEAGVIFSSGAIFEREGKPIVTFFVDNNDAFVKYLEKNFGEKFNKENGVEVNGLRDTFIKDNQVWVAPHAGLQSKDIVVFLNLKEEESYLSHNVSGQMVKSKDILAAVANSQDLSSFLGNQALALSAALPMGFDGGKYLYLTVNATDGKVLADLTVLNDSFKPAPLALKLNKVDMQTINSFTGKGDALFAFAPNSQSISSLLDQFSGFGVMADNADRGLRMLDGTIVGSMDLSTSSSNPALSLLFTFGDQYSSQIAAVAPDFVNLIGQQLQPSVQGNHLMLSSNTPSNISNDNLKSRFNGSYGGWVISTGAMSANLGFNISEFITGASLLLLPNSNGIKLQFTIDTRKGQNALISLMQAVLKSKTARPMNSTVAAQEENQDEVGSMYSDDDEELIDLNAIEKIK